MLKSGTRLESQVCDTQVIVVRTAAAFEKLNCGGAPMVPIGEVKAAYNLDTRYSGGTALGKRYVDETGGEILVTRPGSGTLSVGDAPLQLKEAKQLPSSD